MADRRSPSNQRMWPIVTVALILGLSVAGYFVVRDLMAFGRAEPEFRSLADDPDPSVHGTVAYYAVAGDPKTQPTGGCVRVIAAAGAPVEDVTCFDSADDEIGPELVFLPDGRLVVTMFSWPPDQPLVAAWQRTFDIRTGEAVDTPAADLPRAPTPLPPTTTPTGETVGVVSRANHVELVLTGSDGSERTLWEGDVSPDYGMQAVWAPNGEWILAFDGRLLRVSLDDPADIGILVADPAAWGAYGTTDPPITIFAVTDIDLLRPEG